MGHKHTEEYKAMMSERRAAWWRDLKETDPEGYKSVCDNIGRSSKGRGLGKCGPESPGWKGGRYIQQRDGYVYVYAPDHPFAKKNGKGGGGYILEHRLVVEAHLGRYLTKDEEVHHINGIKDDNRLENLEVVVKSMHFGMVVCPHCQKEFKVK